MITMKKLVTERIGILSFSFVLFIILPFIYVRSTLDPETNPRLIVISILLFIFSCVYFFKSFNHSIKQNNFPASSVVICFAGYILFTGLSMIQSLNIGDALYQFIK